MTATAKIPEIRFKGFEGEWDSCLLGERGKTQSGVGFPENEQGGELGIPFYKVSDMNNIGNEHEMQNANNYVSERQIHKKAWKPIENLPAMIFAKVGAAIMLNRKRLTREKFLIDNNTMAYSFDDTWVPEFGKTLFETIDLTKYIQTGALPSYSGSDIEAISIYLPDKLEQTRICSFFSELDKLIAQMQAKLDKTKNLKKAMLQKMFPQKGETVPKIRFKGFDGGWVETKFCELVERITTQSDADNMPKVEYEDIVAGEGRLNKDLSRKFDKRRGVLFKPNNILYGKLRPYLKNWLVPNFAGIALGDFWVLEAINSAPLFNYCLIQTQQYQDFVNMTTGTKMPRADWNTVKNASFYAPTDFEEQEQIGNYFSQIDQTLALYTKQLEKLKNLKAALLGKMFV